MSQQQQEIDLLRDVNATLIPHGEEFLLPKGDKVTITHRLGGNFTVMTLNGMYRIAAKDADALGEKGNDFAEKNHPKGTEPASEESIRNNLKSVFDPEIPVNVVDLG
jgi:hypothetical protein